MPRVVLLGAPGAGKGTYGQRIAQRYAVPYVSTGEMLRRDIRDGTPLGVTVRPYVEQGALVPDDLILAAVLARLTGPDSRDGYVLDGFPRTVPQAIAADAATAERGGLADAVVFLDVPEEELLRRIARRARVSGRVDDQADGVIAHRLQEYATKTTPVRDYYERKGVLTSIEAVGPEEDVTSRTFADLDRVLAR